MSDKVLEAVDQQIKNNDPLTLYGKDYINEDILATYHESLKENIIKPLEEKIDNIQPGTAPGEPTESRIEFSPARTITVDDIKDEYKEEWNTLSVGGSEPPVISNWRIGEYPLSNLTNLKKFEVENQIFLTGKYMDGGGIYFGDYINGKPSGLLGNVASGSQATEILDVAEDYYVLTDNNQQHTGPFLTCGVNPFENFQIMKIDPKHYTYSKIGTSGSSKILGVDYTSFPPTFSHHPDIGFDQGGADIKQIWHICNSSIGLIFLATEGSGSNTASIFYFPKNSKNNPPEERRARRLISLDSVPWNNHDYSFLDFFEKSKKLLCIGSSLLVLGDFYIDVIDLYTKQSIFINIENTEIFKQLFNLQNSHLDTLLDFKIKNSTLFLLYSAIIFGEPNYILVEMDTFNFNIKNITKKFSSKNKYIYFDIFNNIPFIFEENNSLVVSSFKSTKEGYCNCQGKNLIVFKIKNTLYTYNKETGENYICNLEYKNNLSFLRNLNSALKKPFSYNLQNLKINAAATLHTFFDETFFLRKITLGDIIHLETDRGIICENDSNLDPILSIDNLTLYFEETSVIHNLLITGQLKSSGSPNEIQDLKLQIQQLEDRLQRLEDLANRS